MKTHTTTVEALEVYLPLPVTDVKALPAALALRWRLCSDLDLGGVYIRRLEARREQRDRLTQELLLLLDVYLDRAMVRMSALKQ